MRRERLAPWQPRACHGCGRKGCEDRKLKVMLCSEYLAGPDMEFKPLRWPEFEDPFEAFMEVAEI